jgi:hypothetical protein
MIEMNEKVLRSRQDKRERQEKRREENIEITTNRSAGWI